MSRSNHTVQRTGTFVSQYPRPYGVTHVASWPGAGRARSRQENLSRGGGRGAGGGLQVCRESRTSPASESDKCRPTKASRPRPAARPCPPLTHPPPPPAARGPRIPRLRRAPVGPTNVRSRPQVPAANPSRSRRPFQVVVEPRRGARGGRPQLAGWFGEGRLLRDCVGGKPHPFGRRRSRPPPANKISTGFKKTRI